MFRRALPIVALAFALGCSNSATSPSTGNGNGAGDAKTLRIAVIPKGTTHEFWKSVHAGAANAAKELGNVEIFWEGPLQENDRAGQITKVENFIVKKVDGICLAPLDSQALIEPVEQARDAGIPVVIFDSGLDGDASNYVTYVASDNYNGGAIAARRMGEVLEGKGDVILLRYAPGSESTTQREEGFLDTLAKEFPGVNVLSSDKFSGTSPESALDAATQLLNKHKDEVDGFFSVCEPNAAGAFGALEETELAGKVKFIAFDPNSDLIHAMGQGKVAGIVLQDPVKMGYEAVRSMVRHLKGETVEKRINTGEYVATPENMNDTGDPNMKQLLEPEQF